METHSQDPRSDEGRDPWDTFHENFGGLGDRLKSTYRRVANDQGPTEDEIKDAFSTLTGAWNQVAGAVGEALQDPEVRQRLKDAASSFASAIGTTISELGSELKGSGWRPTKPEHDEEE